MNLELITDLIEEYSKNLTYTGVCPSLFPKGGSFYWEIEHGLSTSNVIAGLFNKEGKEVRKILEVVSPYKVIVNWKADVEEVHEGDYTVLIVSGGASSGIVIDSLFSDVSMNAVRNSTITKAIHEINLFLHDFNSGEGVS